MNANYVSILSQPQLIIGVKCPLCKLETIHYVRGGLFDNGSFSDHTGNLYVSISSDKLYCDSVNCSWEHIL